MSISKKQLADRDKYIGGSELSTILGVNPYKSAYDLWLEKTGKVERQDLTGNKAVEVGNYFEDGLLKFAADTLGMVVDKKNTERRVKGTPIKVHLDGIVRETGEPVEAKTSNIM